MPSLSPQISNRMPDFNSTTDSANYEGNQRPRNRRRGTHRGSGRNRQRNASAGPRSSTESPNIPPASAFMGRSQLGRQSAEEHLKQMTPELRQWVSELAPLLEVYDYDARDIADLVKQCQFDSVKIQNAVDSVFEEKRGHELGEWQVSRGKRRNSNSRKEDSPTPPPTSRQQRGRNQNSNNVNQQTNNGTIMDITCVSYDCPSAQDAVGGRDSSSTFIDQIDNDRQRVRQNFNNQQYNSSYKQRRRSTNNGPRGRPKGSRLRGDSIDTLDQGKEQELSTPQHTMKDVKISEKAIDESIVAKASPPNSWARVAAGALRKKTIGSQMAASQQGASQSSESRTATIIVNAEETRKLEKTDLTSPPDDDESDSGRIDNDAEQGIEEIGMVLKEHPIHPAVLENQQQTIKSSPLQQPIDHSSKTKRSPSVSPQPASIQDPTPSSPLPLHQHSPSVGETSISDGQSTSLNDPNLADDVVLPPPVGRDVVLPRHIAGTPSRFSDKSGFVFGTLQRGSQRVADVHFGVNATSADDHRHAPVQSSNAGPPGLAESPRVTAAVRESSNPAEVQADIQKVDGYSDGSAIAERKALPNTKTRNDRDACSTATMSNQPSQPVYPTHQAQQHTHQQQQPQQQQPHHPQQTLQQQHLVYDGYGAQQHHPVHQQHRLQEFNSGIDDAQGHPRRHYNNMVRHNNQSIQGGPGGLKSQRANTNRMSHRTNSGGLGGYHQPHHQQHHQGFSSHDDYLDRIPQQHYQQQYHNNQRGMSNRGGYGSFRDYNSIGFNSEFASLQGTTTMSQAAENGMPPLHQTSYGSAPYSTNYSYTMNYNDAQHHLHDASQHQVTSDDQSYHQQRNYNQMRYRQYSQQMNSGYGHHVDLQHKSQQLPHYSGQQQSPNGRFGGSVDATNGSVDPRQSQQQPQQQQPQPHDTSSQQISSANTSATGQAHPSTAGTQQSQMWRQPNHASSSYALYDPHPTRQQGFSSGGFDYDQQQAQGFDVPLRYCTHQPLIQNALPTSAPSTAAATHQMIMMDSANVIGSTTGNHRGYGTANPSGSYATTAPSYLYDSNNGITSAGVPMDYAATSALLQQHAAAAAATQAQLGGFASHQGQRTAALDHGYASGMYSSYDATQQYPTQSTRHL